jgi:hypothetical protein
MFLAVNLTVLRCVFVRVRCRMIRVVHQDHGKNRGAR